MALEIKQQQRMSQQLVITPQLRQAIKILQVSRAELEQLVDEELEENPVLEEAVTDERETERRGRGAAHRGAPRGQQRDRPKSARRPSQRETTTEVEPDNGLNGVDWEDYFRNHENDRHDIAAPPAATSTTRSGRASRTRWCAASRSPTTSSGSCR